MNEKQKSKKMKTLDLNTLRTYTTLYHTYRLLYSKGHIENASNYSIRNMEKSNKENKTKTMDRNTLRVIK